MNSGKIQSLWEEKFMDDSSNSTGDEVAIFVDFNLGTHIAMAVSADTTAGEIKRKAEKEHLNCLPEFGAIMVNQVMIKRNSRLYHLPESFPLKKVFEGSKRAWFIHMKVWSQSDQPAIFKYMDSEIVDHLSSCCNGPVGTAFQNCASTQRNKVKRRRNKRNVKRFYFLRAAFFAACNKEKRRLRINKKNSQLRPREAESQNLHCSTNDSVIVTEKFGVSPSSMEVEDKQNCNFSPAISPRMALSESPSVSGIIKKYFSVGDEVSSSSVVNFAASCSQRAEQSKAMRNKNCLAAHNYYTPQSTAKTPDEVLHFPLSNDHLVGSKGKTRRANVGKRLLVASNNLGISASLKRPVVSLCRLQDGNLLHSKSSSLVRALVFELSSDDD